MQRARDRNFTISILCCVFLFLFSLAVCSQGRTRVSAAPASGASFGDCSACRPFLSTLTSIVTPAHAQDMATKLGSSACTVVWLVSGVVSVLLYEQSFISLTRGRDRYHAGIPTWSCAAARPICACDFCSGQPGTGLLHVRLIALSDRLLH